PVIPEFYAKCCYNGTVSDDSCVPSVLAPLVWYDLSQCENICNKTNLCPQATASGPAPFACSCLHHSITVAPNDDCCEWVSGSPYGCYVKKSSDCAKYVSAGYYCADDATSSTGCVMQ